METELNGKSSSPPAADAALQRALLRRSRSRTSGTSSSRRATMTGRRPGSGRPSAPDLGMPGTASTWERCWR